MQGFYMKRLLSVSALLLTFSIGLHAQANKSLIQRTRIAKQSSTITGDRGSFTVSSSETLNKGQYSFGFAWNNYDRTPKDIDINSLPVYASYGLFNGLSVSGMMELRKEIVANNLAQSGNNSALPFVNTHYQTGFGDSILSVKYKLQRKKDNVGGIAFRGFVKVPTGNDAKGLSTGRPDVGAELLFTSLLPLNFLMHSSMGFVSTTDVKSPATNVRDEMRSGIAALWPATGISVGKGEVQGVFEYTTQTFVGCCSDPATPAKTQNATDVTFGVRYLLLDSGVHFDAGYRFNKGFDKTDPLNKDRRGFIGAISYTKPDSVKLGNNRNPLVTAETDKATISATETANLTATGYDADSDTLTYTWTATGGQVTGSGAKATYRANGAAAGKYTVRVVANDGKGGTADAEVEITVR
jgi:hypothetical protein